MTDKSKQPVSIHPSSFTDDYGLLDASMEDVVALFLDKEKQRYKLSKDDENQQDDVVGSRTVPMGLIMSLDSASRHLGITRSMLTKCLSHQIMAWLESMPRIKELIELFNVAHDAAAEYGYPDLYDGMRPGYLFANVSPRYASFRTIRWVKNGLSSMSMPLGVPVGSLFITGLCYSLSKTSDPSSKGTVSKYLLAEVNRFEQHVEEQFIHVFRFHDLVRKRASDDGLGQAWERDNRG